MFVLQLRSKMWDIPLTQALVVAEHVEDALATLPLVAAAVARAPLGNLRAAVAHIVRSHDGAWWQRSASVMILEQNRRIKHLHSTGEKNSMHCLSLSVSCPSLPVLLSHL